MSDVFYLRPVSPSVSPEDVQRMGKYSGGCFHLHKVDWRYSFLSADGGRMLCWYRAPDAESVRIALRQLGADMDGVWSGRLLPQEPATSAEDLDAVDVVAEICFDVPVPDDAKLLTLLAPLLENDSGTKLVLGLISSSGMRLACLLQAESPEGARSAFERAALPVSRIWRCRTLTPDLQAS